MSIVIRTPSDSSVHMQFCNARLKWNRNFGPERTKAFNAAQEYVDSSVLRYCDPLVPMRTGVLKRSGILGTVIGSGEVKYIAPYARKQYYENRGIGQRGKMWFGRMKAEHIDDILEGAASILEAEKARRKS